MTEVTLFSLSLGEHHLVGIPLTLDGTRIRIWCNVLTKDKCGL